jgi:hypothetical protein
MVCHDVGTGGAACRSGRQPSHAFGLSLEGNCSPWVSVSARAFRHSGEVIVGVVGLHSVYDTTEGASEKEYVMRRRQTRSRLRVSVVSAEEGGRAGRWDRVRLPHGSHVSRTDACRHHLLLLY